MLLSCGVERRLLSVPWTARRSNHPKGNPSWIFTGRTDVEGETPTLQPPDAKNWLLRKDPDARKDWRQEEKGTIEDEMVGWNHQLNGHEFEQTLGVGDGQGGLVCCNPWVHKKWDITEQLNWTEMNGLKCILLIFFLQYNSKSTVESHCFRHKNLCFF